MAFADMDSAHRSLRDMGVISRMAPRLCAVYSAFPYLQLLVTMFTYDISNLYQKSRNSCGSEVEAWSTTGVQVRQPVYVNEIVMTR